jgi:hypothetical protein
MKMNDTPPPATFAERVGKPRRQQPDYIPDLPSGGELDAAAHRVMVGWGEEVDGETHGQLMQRLTAREELEKLAEGTLKTRLFGALADHYGLTKSDILHIEVHLYKHAATNTRNAEYELRLDSNRKFERFEESLMIEDMRKYTNKQPKLGIGTSPYTSGGFTAKDIKPLVEFVNEAVLKPAGIAEINYAALEKSAARKSAAVSER